MQLTRGLNHIAVMTDDLDRLVEFYTDIFDLEVGFSETTQHSDTPSCASARTPGFIPPK